MVGKCLGDYSFAKNNCHMFTDYCICSSNIEQGPLNWEKLLKCYVDFGILNENTIIFAHSIAPIFICKFLVKNKITVKRLVFVCGFNNYLGIDEE
jgi:hypothetical protein